MKQSSRRRRLRRTSLLLCTGLLLQPLLQGCGGGGGGGGTTNPGTTNPPVIPPPQADQVPTRQSSGKVARNEIGGQSLKLQSAWQVEAPIGTDGAFRTTVSQAGAQLLFATDAQYQVRGLTISLPAARGRQATPLAVDARSTALAYLWLTPGILDTDPETAAERLAAIEALASFAAFRTYLQGALRTQPLSAVRDQAEFKRLAEACLEEWATKHRSRAVDPDLDAHGLVTGRGADESDKKMVAMKLSNGGFRWVSVQRRGLHANGNLAEVVPLTVVEGASPFSWGALATALLREVGVSGVLDAHMGTPSTYIDEVDFERNASCEYWIRGLGQSKLNDTPPGDLVPNQAWENGEVVYKTVFLYAVTPLIDAVMGFKDVLLSQRFAAVNVAWSVYQIYGGSRSALQRLRAADGSPQAFAAAAVDVVKETIGLMGPLAEALLKAGVLTKGSAAALKLLAGSILPAAGIVIGALSITLSAANLLLVADHWCQLPQWTHIKVKTNGELDIQIRSPRAGHPALRGGVR